MKYIISSDSTCDLGEELIKQNNIQIMPLNVLLGEENFLDGSVSTQQIFDFVEKTGQLPKTAARSIVDYTEHFQKCLTMAEAVIHISLSSEISSSYSNAKLASDELKNVIVIDSKSLSTGQGLVALKACELASLDLNLNEIEKQLIAHTQKIQASFVISNLKYLYKGGRCSALAMFGANLLKIKPSIHLQDGKMGVGKKYMGKFEDSLKKYVACLIEENKDIDKSKVFITYSSDCSNVREALEKMLQDFGFEKIYKTVAGCTISSHCGPECMGVLFARN